MTTPEQWDRHEEWDPRDPGKLDHSGFERKPVDGDSDDDDKD